MSVARKMARGLGDERQKGPEGMTAERRGDGRQLGARHLGRRDAGIRREGLVRIGRGGLGRRGNLERPVLCGLAVGRGGRGRSRRRRGRRSGSGLGRRPCRSFWSSQITNPTSQAIQPAQHCTPLQTSAGPERPGWVRSPRQEENASQPAGATNEPVTSTAGRS